ncbi:hypothetical protein [Paenibacillus sp. KN14-4R]
MLIKSNRLMTVEEAAYYMNLKSEGFMTDHVIMHVVKPYLSTSYVM